MITGFSVRDIRSYRLDCNKKRIEKQVRKVCEESPYRSTVVKIPKDIKDIIKNWLLEIGYEVKEVEFLDATEAKIFINW